MTVFRILTFVTGLLFGLCVEAQPTGCGVLDTSLRGSYDGGCVSGLAHGYGIASGLARYQGEFRSGRPHGKGRLVFPGGDTYEGELFEGRPSGTGTYVWSSSGPRSGERYDGHFLEGLAHGIGARTWANGDRYVGEWRAGRPMGPFTPSMVRREREYAERATAVGIPGARVCRKIVEGIAVPHWVSGRAVGLAAERLRVKLDDPGTLALVLNGALVSAGMEIEDDFLSWIPCR